MPQKGREKLMRRTFQAASHQRFAVLALVVLLTLVPASARAATPPAAADLHGDASTYGSLGDREAVARHHVCTDSQACALSPRGLYIVHADPLCQAANGPLVNANQAFFKNLGRLNHRLKTGHFKGARKTVDRTAGALERFNDLHAALTTQLSLVQPAPPPEDAGTINTWLAYRRSAEGFAASAVRAMSQIKFRRFNRQYGRAVAAEEAGIRLVAGFGFQHCG